MGQAKRTCRFAVNVHYDIKLWPTTVMNDTDKTCSLILNDPNPKMFIPHSIDSHGALA